jgi:hypothetical protein
VPYVKYQGVRNAKSTKNTGKNAARADKQKA